MSSIPLVALQANTNQPGPIDQYAKAMQLKQLMNANALAPGQQQLQQGQLGLQQKQLQSADIENQKGQQELAQTAAINDAYKRAVTVDPTTGTPKFDTDELSKALAASGHGSAIPSILENITKYDTAHTDLLSKQTKLQTEAADAMGNVGAAIKAANYDPRLTTTIIQHALQQPNLPPQQAQQYQQMAQQIQQNPAVVKQIADQLLASSPEQRKLSAADQQAQARADQAKTGSERLAAELPGGALEPVDKAEFQEFVKSHPSSKNPAQDFAKWKASLNTSAQTAIVQTVDENGQPVTKIVPKVAGSEFAKAPTSTTQTMRESAPGVITFVDKIAPKIDKLQDELGPGAGRWNAFWTGKVGVSNPDLAGLRTDVALLTTKLMRMHVGARGGSQMLEHFTNLVDTAKQDPANLKAALSEIRDYAVTVEHEGAPNGGAQGGGQTSQGNAPPPGAKIRDYSDLK